MAAPRPTSSVEDVLKKETELAITSGEDYGKSHTTFNGIVVPIMKDLKGDTFGRDTKDGYWFIKHYSPYCQHCKAIAPTWQTLYEFYYTSKPISSAFSKSQDSLNSFSRYYNFNFGSLDCVAWGDACIDHAIPNYPFFVLYKDGKEFKRFDGSKDMDGLSRFIEETLESIKPGSRPTEGVHLPQPGATSVDVESSVDMKPSVYVKSSAVTGSTSSASKPTAKPVKPTEDPNPADSWFIKFYAPWCHHCQALAPNWFQMAKELQGKLNVGEVNCDMEIRLCKDVHIKGYPTIHFFRGGERVEYDGLRGLGDLVSYAKKALDIGAGVAYINAAGFKELEETEEVLFVYFFDHATTSEDFEALERLTLSLIGHAKILKTDSSILADRFEIHTWPRLLVSRDGRATYYNALTPKDMRDFYKVLRWMQSVWLPIVPELTASNSKEIMSGRLVVMGILSREHSAEFALNRREIKNAALEWMDRETHAFQLERQELRDAKQMRIEEAEDRGDQRALRAAKSMRIEISEEDRKQVGFAWVDGVFWEKWIRTTYGIDVKDGERIIINDEDNKRYWDTTASGGQILPSRTSILETIPKVVADPPKISPKYTTGMIDHTIFRARGLTSSHPWISFALFVGAVVSISLWGKGRIRRNRVASGGGFFQLDGKEGLLSVGGIGKVD